MPSHYMTSFQVMDWNAKTPLQWDWENIAMFNAKAAENPKKLQPTDWGIESEGGIDTGSLYSSGGGGTGSDVGHVSSSKGSKSVSVDSSSMEKTSKFNFEELEGFRGAKELGMSNSNPTGTSLTLEASVGSGEPLIGLKLGKRTYFEDFCAGSNAKASSIPAAPIPSAPTAKRCRSSCQNTVSPHCQVEGCNMDLSSAKEYHRKHRICLSHSKCPKVIVSGLERRFCQQCSRFHGLADFDEKKRSCRKRLSDHNARRRKPRQETMQFNSARLFSSLYDETNQMGNEFNKFSLVHTRPVADPTWEGTCNSKFTITKECPPRPGKTRGIDGQLHPPGNEQSNAVTMLYHDSKWPLSSKAGTSEVLTEDLEESMISTNLDAAQDLRRALSLLSTNSWGSCDPEAVSMDQHPMHVTSTSMPHSVMDGVSQGLPLAAPENWRTEQHQSSVSQVQASPRQTVGNTHFPEFQLFKVPYESSFYSSQFN